MELINLSYSQEDEEEEEERGGEGGEDEEDPLQQNTNGRKISVIILWCFMVFKTQLETWRWRVQI